MTVVLRGLDGVRSSVGLTLGPTDWVTIDADRLSAWERACPGSPVGYLLLSLTNLFMPEMLTVEDVSAGLNIGTGEIRFADDLAIAPGTQVRARGEITSVEEPKPETAQTVIHITVESDSHPLLEVDAISRWLA
jgi:hypothetical protein